MLKRIIFEVEIRRSGIKAEYIIYIYIYNVYFMGVALCTDAILEAVRVDAFGGAFLSPFDVSRGA